MKKRGLDSPDRADALALALYLGKSRSTQVRHQVQVLCRNCQKIIIGADIARKRGDEDERVWTDWTETLGRRV